MTYEVIENLSIKDILNLFEDTIISGVGNDEFIANSCGCLTRNHYSGSTCSASGVGYFECYIGSSSNRQDCIDWCKSYCNASWIGWFYYRNSNYLPCTRV